MELDLKQNVCIAEHALLQRDDQELRLRKVLLDHLAYVLGVLQVERRIYLI